MRIQLPASPHYLRPSVQGFRYRFSASNENGATNCPAEIEPFLTNVTPLCQIHHWSSWYTECTSNPWKWYRFPVIKFLAKLSTCNQYFHFSLVYLTRHAVWMWIALVQPVEKVSDTCHVVWMWIYGTYFKSVKMTCRNR